MVRTLRHARLVWACPMLIVAAMLIVAGMLLACSSTIAKHSELLNGFN